MTALLLLLCLGARSATGCSRPKPDPCKSAAPGPDKFWTEDKFCHCGLGGLGQPWDYGAREARHSEFPWQVGIGLLEGSGNLAIRPTSANLARRQWKPMCSGALLSSNTVLTAASCLTNINKNNLYVKVGDHDWYCEDGERLIKVVSAMRHPLFNSQTEDYNFAILTLTLLQPTHYFSNRARPVCLPSTSLSYRGKKATVSGWGSLGGPRNYSKALKQVGVDIKNVCRSTTANMLCANAPSVDPDPVCCTRCLDDGDSGAPLVTKGRDGLYTLVGVLSRFLIPDNWCQAEPQSLPYFQTGVYSRVAAGLDWINANIQGAICTRQPKPAPTTTTTARTTTSVGVKPICATGAGTCRAEVLNCTFPFTTSGTLWFGCPNPSLEDPKLLIFYEYHLYGTLCVKTGGPALTVRECGSDCPLETPTPAQCNSETRPLTWCWITQCRAER